MEKIAKKQEKIQQLFGGLIDSGANSMVYFPQLNVVFRHRGGLL